LLTKPIPPDAGFSSTFYCYPCAGCSIFYGAFSYFFSIGFSSTFLAVATITTMKSASFTPKLSNVSVLVVFFPLKTSFCD
jgi:hypothetical protein